MQASSCLFCTFSASAWFRLCMSFKKCLSLPIPSLWAERWPPCFSAPAAARHAQLEFPCVRANRKKRHKKNRTVIDKTSETRERLNRASSCLSFCRSATHAWFLSFSLCLFLSLCRSPSLCHRFLFHHCVATNTPFWQRLNCADTLDCAGQNGRLVKAVVVCPLLGIIRCCFFFVAINHQQTLCLF